MLKPPKNSCHIRRTGDEIISTNTKRNTLSKSTDSALWTFSFKFATRHVSHYCWNPRGLAHKGRTLIFRKFIAKHTFCKHFHLTEREITLILEKWKGSYPLITHLLQGLNVSHLYGDHSNVGVHKHVWWKGAKLKFFRYLPGPRGTFTKASAPLLAGKLATPREGSERNESIIESKFKYFHWQNPKLNLKLILLPQRNGLFILI